MKTINNRAWFAQAIWLVLLLLGAGYFLKSGNVVSDISQFMPQSSSNPQLAVLLNEMQQGSTSRYLLLRVQASKDIDTAALSRAIKAELQAKPFFSQVQNGDYELSLDKFMALYPYRFLLSETQGFTTTALRQSLEERLSEIRSGMGPLLKQTLPSDPQNRFYQYLLRQAGQANPVKHLGVWFDQQQQGAMLLVTLAGSGFDLNRQQQAIDVIRHTVAQLSNAEEIQLEMTGPAMMAVATRDAIKSTMTYLSSVAGGLMLVLFIWGYRSVKGVLLAGLPLLSAVVVALVATQLVFGMVHGIVIAFGITLLGVCLDFPLHLFSHLNRQQTPAQTLDTIWPTLRLSVVTTLFAYLALFGTDFSGLSQLAVFAIAGLSTALLTTRWVIPAWTSYANIDARQAVLVVQCKVGCKLVIIGACLLIPAVIFWVKAGQIWSMDIRGLSPVPEKARLLDQRLRRQMAAPEVSDLFFVRAKAIEPLLQKTESLVAQLSEAKQQGLIQDVQAVTRLLPSAQLQQQRQQQLLDRQELEERLAMALEGLPFKASVFDAFIDDVQQSKALTPIGYEDLQQTPLAEVLNRDLLQRDGEWLTMIRLTGLEQREEFMQWLQARPDLEPHYLNPRQATSLLMHEYQQTALQRLVLGLLIIGAALLLLTRSGRTTLRVTLPIVLAVMVTMSVQVATGTALNLFHILSLLLVVGMGLDYSLFFNRRVSHTQDLNRRTHGVMMGAGSTLAAFGVLAFADIPVLAAMGQTVSIGVLCCYVLAQLLANPQQQ